MKGNKSRDKILIFNTSFFAVSETFIYNQVRTLSEDYDVDLLAYKFLNPHDYNYEQYNRYKVDRVRGFTDRVVQKLFNARLFTLESYKTIRKLFYENEYKAIHAHYGTKAIEILPIAKWYKVALVVSFHGADASRALRDKKYKNKLPDLFDYASAITISSMHMAENLGLSAWSEKVHFIPYGVDQHYFVPDSENKTNGKIKILHTGRIVNKKGVPDLIKVFQQLSNDYDEIELHLAGDGDEMPQCKKLVEQFGIDQKVLFYGNVTHQKVKELLDEADIFVLNSRVDKDGDMEGTPNGILEAMCMGKPVVSTKHAGIPYVIEHKKNGLLVDERDNNELKGSIEMMIKNPELREKLGEGARDTILKSYTMDVMEQKIKEIFRAI